MGIEIRKGYTKIKYTKCGSRTQERTSKSPLKVKEVSDDFSEIRIHFMMGKHWYWIECESMGDQHTLV